MLTQRTTIAVCVLACGSLAAATMMNMPQTDFEKLPPDPAEIQLQLAKLDLTLTQAIAVAEEEAGGKAKSASLNPDAQPPTAEVLIYADNQAKRVIVDASSGQVRSMEIVPRFPGEATDGEIVETASGLRYIDLVVGEGEQPAGTSSTVTVHYSGWMVDGTMFDSSHRRGQPISFPLGGVIPGWSEGVASMRVGGKRKLIIPQHLAYGDRPPPGSGIPRRAMLIFDVELLEVRD